MWWEKHSEYSHQVIIIDDVISGVFFLFFYSNDNFGCDDGLIDKYFLSVPVVLVGNKTDLHQERAVSYEEGKKMAESWRATFLETSAKQNEVSHIEQQISIKNYYLKLHIPFLILPLSLSLTFFNSLLRIYSIR